MRISKIVWKRPDLNRYEMAEARAKIFSPDNPGRPLVLRSDRSFEDIETWRIEYAKTTYSVAS